MAVQTWGVDKDFVLAHNPQLEFELTSPITEARLTVLVETASSRVNGVILAHGLTPDDLAAVTTTETYAICRGLVIACLAPLLDVALLVDSAASEVKCLERIAAFEALPQILGAGADGIGPRTSTSTEYLGVTISDTARATRRSFGAGWDGF